MDYYFALLTLSHTYSLNRDELQAAQQTEKYMNQYLSIHKAKWQTAQTWLCKLERFFKQKDYTEMLASIH